MVEARPAEARILYLGFPSGLNVKCLYRESIALLRFLTRKAEISYSDLYFTFA